jgi:lipopolysaccharide/colanic/teichoic acid biosynthesis glycosyltransferase
MTSLWPIKAREEANFGRRIERNVETIDQRSLGLDIKTLLTQIALVTSQET